MKQKPIKIGVLIAPLVKDYDNRAINYLVLQMNTLQDSFEYQILPFIESDFLDKLSYNQVVDRNEIEKSMPIFINDYNNILKSRSSHYDLRYEDAFP